MVHCYDGGVTNGDPGVFSPGRCAAGAREAAADGQDPLWPRGAGHGPPAPHDVLHAAGQPHERCVCVCVCVCSEFIL